MDVIYKQVERVCDLFQLCTLFNMKIVLLLVTFFPSRIQEGEGLNSWDWRSLCSHQVPMKFSMCSYQVPYAFATCSQCVCNLFPNFLLCVPQDILNTITLYPITFAQSWILITNIGGAKGQHLNNSIQGAQSFIWGSVRELQNMFFVMGKSKWLNAKQEQNWNLGCTPN